MKNPKSAVYEAVQRGRKPHAALETDHATDAFERAVLRKFKREIGVDIDETWGREQGLVSARKQFKGKFDGVGVFRGLETVWDYKKVNRPKTLAQMKNYFKQCAAYAIAHDEMYGTRIQQVAVMTVSGKTARELGTHVFTLAGAELKQARRDFLKDLGSYYELFPIGAE
jgi:genome maintenance exonuclease 1